MLSKTRQLVRHEGNKILKRNRSIAARQYRHDATGVEQGSHILARCRQDRNIQTQLKTFSRAPLQVHLEAQVKYTTGITICGLCARVLVLCITPYSINAEVLHSCVPLVCDVPKAREVCASMRYDGSESTATTRSRYIPQLTSAPSRKPPYVCCIYFIMLCSSALKKAARACVLSVSASRLIFQSANSCVRHEGCCADPVLFCVHNEDEKSECRRLRSIPPLDVNCADEADVAKCLEFECVVAAVMSPLHVLLVSCTCVV
jgi:hypothetical protein